MCLPGHGGEDGGEFCPWLGDLGGGVLWVRDQVDGSGGSNHGGKTGGARSWGTKLLNR